jgi:N6-adenosine-specific RNA methylase IME4
MRAVKVKAAPRATKPATRTRPAETRRLEQIKIGKRHRKDYGDVAALARSIDERGALLQPIVIDEHNTLIAGERRIRAWQLSKFKDLPIPVHVVRIDAIIAGEWDENAQRKDFTPSEASAIRDEIEKKLKVLAKQRMLSGKRAAAADKGEAGEKASAFTGKSRRTLDKAKEIVEAAKQNPKKFGPLKAAMDKTGRVDGPHKRLKVMQQTEAIKTAPPALPMRPAAVVSIDFPWPADPGKEQDTIDAQGRSFRGYPEMSIKTCCKFASEQVAPWLPKDVAVWLWVPNWHLVRGYAQHVISALGLADNAVTMLTWVKTKDGKVQIGRGQVLRDATEHCILLTRGKPVVNVYGEDPPTTVLFAPRRDNSQKPDEFYRLVERVTPAKRYAAIFSRGGEGELWDSHGDEVGKYAPGIEPPKPAATRQSVKDLIKPGDKVSTNYGTGPYRVLAVSGPFGRKWKTYSLELVPADKAPPKRGKEKPTAWINELRAVDGRILGRGTDEVFIDGGKQVSHDDQVADSAGIRSPAARSEQADRSDDPVAVREAAVPPNSADEPSDQLDLPAFLDRRNKQPTAEAPPAQPAE